MTRPVCFAVVCREVVGLLRELKKEATLLVVSHDLADIAPLVDCAWRMKVGGSGCSVYYMVCATAKRRVMVAVTAQSNTATAM